MLNLNLMLQVTQDESCTYGCICMYLFIPGTGASTLLTVLLCNMHSELSKFRVMMVPKILHPTPLPHWRSWGPSCIYIYVHICKCIYIIYNIYIYMVPCPVFPPPPWDGRGYDAPVVVYIHTYIPTYLPTYIPTYIHTYIPLHYLTLHYLTLPYLTLHYLTLHSIHTYIPLHYLTLHYLTLHYLTLHSIRTYIHTYTDTHIHTYTDTHIHTYIHTNIPTYQHTTTTGHRGGDQKNHTTTTGHRGGGDQKNHTTTTGHRGGGPEEPDDTVHPYPLVGGGGGVANAAPYIYIHCKHVYF